jgi:hypothetical protein
MSEMIGSDQITQSHVLTWLEYQTTNSVIFPAIKKGVYVLVSDFGNELVGHFVPEKFNDSLNTCNCILINKYIAIEQ